MSEIKKLEQQINKKLRRKEQIDDLNQRLDDVVRIYRETAKAFRETLDRVNKDFNELKARVDKLEGE